MSSASDPAVLDAAGILTANLHTLCTRDQQFAQSLLNSLAAGKCSHNQGVWIIRLAERAKPFARGAAAGIVGRAPLDGSEHGTGGFSQPGANAPVPATGVGLARLLRLFQRAKAHLKRPRITISLTPPGLSTVRLTFKLSPDKGKNPNHIYVFLNDGPASAYAGKITPQGEWFPIYPAITPAVVAFDQDPAAAASAHGKLTGSCCFCSLPLTDARSVTVGYGETCADHYGLPWGNKAGAPDADALFAPVAQGVASVPPPAAPVGANVAAQLASEHGVQLNPTPVASPAVAAPAPVVQPDIAAGTPPEGFAAALRKPPPAAPASISVGAAAVQLRAMGAAAARLGKSRKAPFADLAEQTHWYAGYDSIHRVRK